jgi:hypothetical protein
MLLRIIDLPGNAQSNDGIRIVFTHSTLEQRYSTELYKSPMSDNFRKTLEWYFKDFLQESSAEGDAGVADKLIRVGQYMGDELLGEDHQLIKLKEMIEAKGYENLVVQIESADVNFFKELWEATILPESKYVLSSVVKGFVRQFVQKDFPAEYPELHYELKVTLPEQDSLQKMLKSGIEGHDENEIKPSILNQKPLRLLYLVSRPEGFALPFTSSTGFNFYLETLAAGGVIDVEICSCINAEELQKKLANKNRPIHIIHYDGPLVLENGSASVVLVNSMGSSELFEMTPFSKLLVDNKVGALCVDSRAYFSNNIIVSASEGLATLAQIAHQNGFGNIIGLEHITNPWTSAQCFEAVYSKIAGGFDLAQAVVEARKSLQKNISTSLTSLQAIPFHSWPLLAHYSKQMVVFFESPQTLADPHSAQGLTACREKLFGFRSEMLPPLINQVGSGQLLSLIDQLLEPSSKGKCLSIVGEPGTGRSQHAHLASVYLAQKNIIDYGFYFNYTKDHYSPSDILEMIAPVFDLEVNQIAEIDEKLKKITCCFVLDDFSFFENQLFLKAQNDWQHSWKLLSEFLQTLISYGHTIVLIRDSSSALHPLHPLASFEITTSPLTLIEQKIMSAKILGQLNLTDEKLRELDTDDNYEKLLLNLKGNPWLTKKLMPLVAVRSTTELKNEVELYLTNTDNVTSTESPSKIESFYEWQWGSLKPAWQQLLLLCSETPGLLLEIVMTATDQRETFGPAKTLFFLLAEGDETLAEADATFSDALMLWETSGFLNRFPHGRMIDSRCLAFLATKRKTASFDAITQQKLQLCFSQIICEGIALVSTHIAKNPNPAISNNLLMNRRHWVKHFEALWFHQDYKGFFGVKNAFDQLLQQATLIDESKAWALNVLERSAVIVASETQAIDAAFSWLALALNALGQTEAHHSHVIREGVAAWRLWFDAFAASENIHQVALFSQAARFLEMYYQGKSSWRDAIVICEKAAVIYTQHNAWQRVSQSFKSLARYHQALGETDKVLFYENKILYETPSADSLQGEYRTTTAAI